MLTGAKKITLPRAVITRLADINDTESSEVKIKIRNQKSFQTYFVKPRKMPRFSFRTNPNEEIKNIEIPTFPLVVD